MTLSTILKKGITQAHSGTGHTYARIEKHIVHSWKGALVTAWNEFQDDLEWQRDIQETNRSMTGKEI